MHSKPAMPGDRSPTLRPGAEVSGVYTTVAPQWRYAKNGNAYLFFKIQLGVHELPVFAWANECEGCEATANIGTVHLLGQLEFFGDRYQVRCSRLAPASPPQDAQHRMNIRLRAMCQWIEPVELQEFLFVAFTDKTFCHRFMNNPASRRHHHAWPGGLAYHSAEVAWDVFQHPWASATERGLATVSGLLHDAGKTATLTPNGDYTAVGRTLSHDDLTLEVLAFPLSWLDNRWSDGAAILRRVLAPTLFTTTSYHNLAEAVRFSDRQSARL